MTCTQEGKRAAARNARNDHVSREDDQTESFGTAERTLPASIARDKAGHVFAPKRVALVPTWSRVPDV
jgi:hypothetical protein